MESECSKGSVGRRLGVGTIGGEQKEQSKRELMMCPKEIMICQVWDQQKDSPVLCQKQNQRQIVNKATAAGRPPTASVGPLFAVGKRDTPP